jgi:hypothetical protein
MVSYNFTIRARRSLKDSEAFQSADMLGQGHGSGPDVSCD